MEYEITLTNGTATEPMQAGTYSVTCLSANGYDVTSLQPTTCTVTQQEGTFNFTLLANGTLNIEVNETGAAGGTPITSGTLVMTDATGTENYGTATITDGVATFSNVPFGAEGSPFTLYFKQTATDAQHNLYVGVITVEMTASTQLVYVENPPIAAQQVNLTDATYQGLPVPSATIQLTGQQ